MPNFTTDNTAMPSRPRQRSTSRGANPSNPTNTTRPTTPLRAPSRTSLRNSTTTPTTASINTHPYISPHLPSYISPGSFSHSTQPNFSSSSSVPYSDNVFPLNSLEPQFAELSDSLADLETNLVNLQFLHESISRFGENFASFLYGLNIGAYMSDYTEAPTKEMFKRFAARYGDGEAQNHDGGGSNILIMDGDGADKIDMRDIMFEGRKERDVDATFLTTDTSFVNDPPASVRTARFVTPKKSMVGRGGNVGRGTSIPSRGRGGGTGLPRGGGSVNSTRGASSRGGLTSTRARGRGTSSR